MDEGHRWVEDAHASEANTVGTRLVNSAQHVAANPARIGHGR